MESLNVHTYKDCDKVIVKLLSSNNCVPLNFSCNRDGDEIIISCDDVEQDANTTECFIEAPIKASKFYL